MRYLLPLVRSISDEEELNELEVLFGILDNETERLKIINYTLECTTLEQIFMEMERQAITDPGAQKLLAKVGLKQHNQMKPVQVCNFTYKSFQYFDIVIFKTALTENLIFVGKSLHSILNKNILSCDNKMQHKALIIKE